MKNTQELESPNADLRNEGKKTYGCRSTAEVAAVSLDRFRLMQRPKSTETEMRRSGGNARAAGGLREEEDGVREENEKAESCLFIRKDVNKRARKSSRAE